LASRLDFRPDLDVDALLVDLTVEEAVERLREGARTKSDAKMGVQVVADLDGTFILSDWRKESQLQVTLHRLGDACVVRMERRRKGLPLVPFFVLLAVLGLVPLAFGFVPLYLVWLAVEVVVLTPITHARSVAWVEETLGVPEQQRRGARRQNSFGWFDARGARASDEYRAVARPIRLPSPCPGLVHDVQRKNEDRGQFVRATVSFHPWLVRGLVAAHVIGVVLLFTTRHLVLIGLVLAGLRWGFRALRGLDRHRLAEAR